MRIVFTLAILFILPFAVFAHAGGEGQTVGEYKIEFSLVPEEPIVDVQQAILLGVEDGETFDPVGDVPVWIRISSSDGVLFTSGNFLSSPTELMTLTMLLQTPGEYTVNAKTLDDAGAGETATFPFTVEGEEQAVAAASADEEPQERSSLQIVTIVLLVIAILLFVYVIGRTKKS